MNILDTRDLIETRESLQEEILNDFNEKFNTEFDSYDEIDWNDESYNEEDLEEFEDFWWGEKEHIEEIDQIESDLGSEFEYGITLVKSEDFEDYTRDLLEDLGYIPKDFPTWIEIDWKATANNVEQDYTTVSYQGTDYLGRA
jgi:hypothetical protein